jgi:hypothetical protein
MGCGPLPILKLTELRDFFSALAKTIHDHLFHRIVSVPAQRHCYAVAAAFLIVIGFCSGPAWGAVGCELNDPDRDVARLFPGSTRYKTVEIELQKLGGAKLAARVEAKLRDRLHGLYETIDVPYTVYVVYAKNKKIGYIHGVTQKGRFGGINVFLVLDLDARIKTFYIQKMSGQYAGKFRSAQFGRQFSGLTLGDFEQYHVITGKAAGRVSGIKNPAPEAEQDFKYIMRGVKKNLLFVDEFLRLSPELTTNK